MNVFPDGASIYLLPRSEDNEHPYDFAYGIPSGSVNSQKYFTEIHRFNYALF